MACNSIHVTGIYMWLVYMAVFFKRILFQSSPLIIQLPFSPCFPKCRFSWPGPNWQSHPEQETLLLHSGRLRGMSSECGALPHVVAGDLEIIKKINIQMICVFSLLRCCSNASSFNNIRSSIVLHLCSFPLQSKHWRQTRTFGTVFWEVASLLWFWLQTDGTEVSIKAHIYHRIFSVGQLN